MCTPAGTPGSGSQSLLHWTVQLQQSLLRLRACSQQRTRLRATVLAAATASVGWSSALMGSCWQQLECPSR
jgi:cytochrome c biogenesis factor